MKGKERNRVSEERAGVFAPYILCGVSGCLKQSDTAPEQIAMLRIGNIGICDNVDFLPRALKRCCAFSFLP